MAVYLKRPDLRKERSSIQPTTTSPLEFQPKLGRPVFTESIKQQERRHKCFCGKVGCTEHPIRKEPFDKKNRAVIRVNRLAKEAALRNDPNNELVLRTLRCRAEIEQLLRAASSKKKKNLVAVVGRLEKVVDSFEKLNRSTEGQQLINRARVVLAAIDSQGVKKS